MSVNHKIIKTILLAFCFPVVIMAQVAPTPPGSSAKEETSQSMPPPQTEPKVEGKTFEMPQEQPPKVTRKELLMQVGIDVLKVLMTPRSKPKQRQRGEDVNLTGCSAIKGYKGRCSVYQFTNKDFPAANSSAQAALASAVNAVVPKDKFSDDKQLAATVWKAAPPKITLSNMVPISNTLGTDWKQVNKGLDVMGKDYGLQYAWIDGVGEIKKYLNMQLPVVVMLDAGSLPQLGNKWWVGHWVTAFAYDKDHIYVTNFPGNKMTWADFESAFKQGELAVGHGTDGKAVVIWR